MFLLLQGEGTLGTIGTWIEGAGARERVNISNLESKAQSF